MGGLLHVWSSPLSADLTASQGRPLRLISLWFGLNRSEKRRGREWCVNGLGVRSEHEMKMFPRRIGFGSKAMITGDVMQIHLSTRKT